MAIEVAVLVSAGRHPVSGRRRRAPADAQALEMGLALTAGGNANLRVLHAGDAGEAALRDYLGMGVDALHVIDVPLHADPVPALVEHLRAVRPALVLTGTQAETGWSSGCVPYALAAALDYAIVAEAVALRLEGTRAELRQALPRGRRRGLRVVLPAVITVSRAASPARQVAYARARRGRLIVEHPSSACVEPPSEQFAIEPARARPRRLTAAGGATPAERLRALTADTRGGARILRPSSAAEAAREILDFLGARGLHVSGADERKVHRGGM